MYSHSNILVMVMKTMMMMMMMTKKTLPYYVDGNTSGLVLSATTKIFTLSLISLGKTFPTIAEKIS